MMINNLHVPAWTEEEKAAVRKAASERPEGKSFGAIARELSPILGRTENAIKQRIVREMRTPEQHQAWLASERRRYLARVPPHANRLEIDLVANRPTADEWRELDARCRAPVRDLTALIFGDPPVGYSALERRT